MLDEALRQGKMLNGNLLNQFPQFSLSGFLFHTVSTLQSVRCQWSRPYGAEINATSGNNQFITFIIHSTKNIIVNDFLILIFTLTPILRKKITSSIQYPNLRYQIELVKPALPVTFQHFFTKF